MKVEGMKELSAPRDVVWQVLNDPAQMAKLMPGVEGFEIKDDRNWQAKVKIPLGLGGLRMTIDFEKVEERAPEFAQLNAKGNGVGAIMNMQTQFHLDRGRRRERRCAGRPTSRSPARSARWASACCSRSSTSRSATCSTALEKQVSEPRRLHAELSASWRSRSASA